MRKATGEPATRIMSEAISLHCEVQQLVDRQSILRWPIDRRPLQCEPICSAASPVLAAGEERLSSSTKRESSLS